MKIKPEYQATIERMYQLFNTCPDPDQTEGEGGWSIKQLLGHLVDSASNNHQRFLRYQPSAQLDFPGYDQEQFVSRSHYEAMAYQSLLSFWYQYNLLIFHIVSHIPEEDAHSMIKIGDRTAVTLDALILDYFAHMEIHEQQIRRIIAG